MFKVKASFDSTQIEKSLTRLIGGHKKTKPLMKKIATQQMNNAQSRIKKTKRDPRGKSWRPWAYSTIQSRIRKGTVSRGMLYDTGHLYSSFKITVKASYFVIENQAAYAGYLQFGTRYMPARPFLGWGRNSSRDVRRLIARHLKEMI